MDTDTLISKVFLRPAIWDKRLKVVTSRAVVIIAGEKFREKWKFQVSKDCFFPFIKPLFKNYCYSKLFNRCV
jgi:hypothetical protein